MVNADLCAGDSANIKQSRPIKDGNYCAGDSANIKQSRPIKDGNYSKDFLQ